MSFTVSDVKGAITPLVTPFHDDGSLDLDSVGRLIEWQLERGLTWDKGKGFDTFGPIGPWLVTRDEIANPQKLAMWLDLNGQRMQTGNTKTMIFNVARLVSYVSQLNTLEPGDIITTGTPPGVGMGKKPQPVFLKKGDVMTLGIEGLGEQRQEVVPFKL